MKVLVTGAAGFIGLNLCERLLNDGHTVVGMDKDRSREPFLHPDVLMVWDDIKYIDYYKDILNGVEVIYHLASASDIERSSVNPSYDLAENVVGTHSVLEYMRKNKLKHLVFSSTSAVYGEDVDKPTPESGVDFDPISQYAASKISVEAFIRAYSNTYGIKAWVFRFGNVIGKYEHRGVIYDFLNKLRIDKNNLEILGNGQQVKSYFHVSDCINGIFHIYKNDKNKNVEVYNLATHDWKTVTELADIVCDELGLNPEYHYTGGDRGWVGDIPTIMLSIDKAVSTGWKPKLSCEEAIRRTVRELGDDLL